MRRVILAIMVCLSGSCAGPLPKSEPMELGSGWQADYSVRVANVERRLCRVHVQSGRGLFACSETANLDDATHYTLATDEVETLQRAYQRVPELPAPTEKPWMIVRTSGQKMFVDDVAMRDPNVAAFVNSIDSVLAAKARLARQTAEIEGGWCNGCGSRSYCRLEPCPETCDDGACVEECVPRRRCHLVGEIGAACKRDDECPSACVGIVGRCE